MPTFTKYKPQSEKELHGIIQAELEALEVGLGLLKREYPTGKGFIDFLCSDSGGRLVIIEVKLHEDENILFQALRYFSDIDNDRFLIANYFDRDDIDPNESPRIILIAERFSDDIRRLSTLVVPEIELFEYTALKYKDKLGIVYHPVSLPVATSAPPEPKTIEKLLAHLRNDDLKPTIEQIRERVKSLNPEIEEYATQSYIGYRHNSGRQIAFIKIFRQSFSFGAHIIDEDKNLLEYDEVRIEDEDQEFDEMMEKVKETYSKLQAT